MTFRRLALSNVKGNWHRYISFYLCSVFAVMVFYIFASFIYHPAVQSGWIAGGSGVRLLLIVCEYIIVIFSFLFISYSWSAFLKSRKKDLGILTLLGMTKWQARRMVLYENIIVAALSIATGVGLGTLFLKLFLMAMTHLLQVESPIPFRIIPKALLLTVLGYFALFAGIGIVSSLRASSSRVVSLLTAPRKPKKPPLYSRWLVLLAALLIGTGYYVAWITTLRNVIATMLPVIFVVVLGTYFLFTQTSVAVLGRLQKTKRLYYRKTNLLTISQLVFRMRDNARILFVVSVLSAVVLTAAGTLYTFHEDFLQKTETTCPQTIGFIERGLNSHRVIDPAALEKILQQDGFSIDYQFRLVGVPMTFQAEGKDQDEGVLISENDYNSIAALLGKEANIDVDYGRTYFVSNRAMISTLEPEFQPGATIDTSVSGQKLSLEVVRELPGPIINDKPPADELFVVDDALYRTLRQRTASDNLVVAYGYELENWRQSGETISKILAQIGDQRRNFSSRMPMYLQLKQTTSLTMFVGAFVSCLFFIAAGSMLYFKLFTELQEDRAHYISLRRIGISRREADRVLTTQIAILFFAPFLVGIVHAAFAFKALGNVLLASVWQYTVGIIGLFFILQVFYFLATRRLYLRSVTGLERT